MMSPPESREKLREVYQRAVEEGIAFDVEADLITAKGNQRRIRLIGTPEFQDGQCVRIYGATQDITHVHTLETQLRQMQKMEAIGQLAGGVAHDFNNLLTPILGLADLCLTEAEKDSELAESLTDIRRAAEQARELTAQLLAFGRKQVLEVRPVDLSQLVQENRRMLRGLIREDIRLEMHLAEDPGRVQADPTQLAQVLMNLTVNALDAMEAGGTLTIETSEAKLDADYVADHPESRTGPHVLLAVSDTGCGMDEETRSHIFEPFYTTKDERHGTGLGLASVYGIVKQHRGHIRVYSEPGQGTTFKIYLPIDAAAREEGATREPAAAAAPPATILLVEDDSAVLKFTAEALGRLGHVALPAASPTEALELASSSDGIDLLISDVVMPDMKGPELYRRVLDAHPSLPVLYMSGYTGNAIAGREALGPDAVVLSKPFTADELGRAISEVLASRP
jgi:signal transduction histidine kinase/ActR/RegA family two-component response regulator